MEEKNNMLQYQIDPIELWLLIPKAINLLLFMYSAFHILNLNRKNKLNQFLFAAFCCWMVWILGDLVIFNIAPINATFFVVAQYLRRVQLAGAVFCSFFFYNAFKVIKFGEDIINKRFWIEFVLFIVVFFLMTLNKMLYLEDINGNEILVSDLPLDQIIRTRPYIPIFFAILSGLPFLVMFYAVFGLIHIINTVIQPGVPQRKKMIQLSIGIALIPIGMLYFLIHSMFLPYTFLYIVIGHIVWTISPIFIVSSQRKRKESE